MAIYWQSSGLEGNESSLQSCDDTVQFFLHGVGLLCSQQSSASSSKNDELYSKLMAMFESMISSKLLPLSTSLGPALIAIRDGASISLQSTPVSKERAVEEFKKARCLIAEIVIDSDSEACTILRTMASRVQLQEQMMGGRGEGGSGGGGLLLLS